ncbi:MAG: hypothetical protein ACYCWW_20745 [Deltaproteobacteria bacterium]
MALALTAGGFTNAAMANVRRRDLRLEYGREPGAERCPARETFAGEVAAYLGYDPFQETAGELLRIALRAVPAGGLAATLELVGPDGRALGRQTLTSPTSDCRQLEASLALAASLAIDPLAPAPAAPVAPRAASPPPAGPSPAPPAPARPSTPTAIGVGIAPIGSVGLSPAPALGIALDLELRRGAYSLGLEGQGNFASGIAVGGGQVETQLLAGSLVPCAHFSPFGVCLLVTSGAEEGFAQGLPNARSSTTPYLGVGARGFIEIPLTERLRLRPAAEVDVPFIQTTLLVGNGEVWTTSSLAATLSLTALVLIP